MNTPSEYALFEGGNLIAESRPEPPRADPKADELSRDELLKLMRWSDQQLETAGGCGLPSPRYSIFTRSGHEYRYSRQTVEQWLERVRSLKVR
jgi:hypothetical protein